MRGDPNIKPLFCFAFERGTKSSGKASCQCVSIAHLLVRSAGVGNGFDPDYRFRRNRVRRLHYSPWNSAGSREKTPDPCHSQDAHRIAAELDHLLAVLGPPTSLTRRERALLIASRFAVRIAPQLVQRGLLSRLRDQTRSVILPAG